MSLSTFRLLKTRDAYLSVSPYNMVGFPYHRVCPMLCPSFGLLSRCKERNRFGHLWSVQPLIKLSLGAVEPPPFPIDTSNIKQYFLIIQTFSKLFLKFFYLPCVKC